MVITRSQKERNWKQFCVEHLKWGAKGQRSKRFHRMFLYYSTSFVDSLVLEEYNLDQSHLGSKMIFYSDTSNIADGYCYIDLKPCEVGTIPDDFEDRVKFIPF